MAENLNVQTPIGELSLTFTDATHVFVTTPSGGTVQVRGKDYTVSARFELADGVWQFVAEKMQDPVQLRTDTYHFRPAAPTIKAQALRAASDAVAAAVEADPGLLGQAEIDKAEKAASRAKETALRLRAELAEADLAWGNAEIHLQSLRGDHGY